MFEKFTDKARKVMSLAQEEARSLGQLYVGTEHLLLGLIKEGEGVAAQALASLDVSYDELLATVKGMVQPDEQAVPEGHIPFAPRTKRVLEAAYSETIRRGQTYISTEHLLLGIVRESNGVAMEALGRLGVSGDAVRNAVNELSAASEDDAARPPMEEPASRPAPARARCSSSSAATSPSSPPTASSIPSSGATARSSA